MPRSPTKSKSKSPAAAQEPTPSRSPTPEGDEGLTAAEIDFVSDGLEISQWFPFFLLAFASLAATFSVVAWAFPHVRAGEYIYAVPLLAGVLGMITSPLIGHFLSQGVLAVTDAVGSWLLYPIGPASESDAAVSASSKRESAGVARGLVFLLVVLAATTAFLLLKVNALSAEISVLRRDIARVALTDAEAHAHGTWAEGVKGWFA